MLIEILFGVIVIFLAAHFLMSSNANNQDSSNQLQNDSGNEDEAILTKIKNGLRQVKVSKKDAALVEQQLDQFSKWEEGAEFTQTRKITVDKLPEFLNNLMESYQNSGIKAEDRKKMDSINYAEEWMSKIVEWKFNADNSKEVGKQGCRYGIMALAKSADGKTVNCVLAIYKLDFEVAAKRYIKDNSFLWGLYSYTTVETENVDKFLKKNEIEKFQNFFRLKALNAFKNEGIIDQISYTDQQALP